MGPVRLLQPTPTATPGRSRRSSAPAGSPPRSRLEAGRERPRDVGRAADDPLAAPPTAPTRAAGGTRSPKRVTPSRNAGWTASNDACSAARSSPGMRSTSGADGRLGVDERLLVAAAQRGAPSRARPGGVASVARVTQSTSSGIGGGAVVVGAEGVRAGPRGDERDAVGVPTADRGRHAPGAHRGGGRAAGDPHAPHRGRVAAVVADDGREHRGVAPARPLTPTRRPSSVARPPDRRRRRAPRRAGAGRSP